MGIVKKTILPHIIPNSSTKVFTFYLEGKDEFRMEFTAWGKDIEPLTKVIILNNVVLLDNVFAKPSNYNNQTIALTMRNHTRTILLGTMVEKLLSFDLEGI